MKKFFKVFLSLVMAITMSLPVGIFAEEAEKETQTNVNITKLKVDNLPSEEFEFKIPYNKIGEEIEVEKLNEYIEKGKRDKVGDISTLDGAVFYCFELPDKDAYDKICNHKDDYSSVKKLLDKTKGEKGLDIKYATADPEGGVLVFNGTLKNNDVDTSKDDAIENFKEGIHSKKTTKDGGKATFVLSDGTSYRNKKEIKYYWIIEERAENDGDAKNVNDYFAVPFGLSLPMRKYNKETKSFDGEKLENVYIYPKNTVGEDVTKEKTVDDERNKEITIDNYQEFTWYLQANIPAGDLEKLTQLEFKDNLVDGKIAQNGVNASGAGTEDINKGFAYIVPKDKELEVYVKQFDNPEDTPKLVLDAGDTKDFTYTFKNGEDEVKSTESTIKLANKFELKFNQKDDADSGGKVLECTKFNKTKLEEANIDLNKPVTVFVKLKARYVDNSSLGEDGALEKQPAYNQGQFNDDLETPDKNGIADAILNLKRGNDFVLRYSYNKTDFNNEADGNKYKPNVKTGGKKFIKFGKDEDKYDALKEAEFYVTRKRTVTYKDPFDGELTEERDEKLKAAKNYGEKFFPRENNGIEYKGKKLEYLAIDKSGRKIWIPESEIVKDGGDNPFKKKIKDPSKFNNATLYEMKSDDNGRFEIKGLEYSEYTAKILVYEDGIKNGIGQDFAKIENDYGLKEFKAPENYQISKELIGFTVADKSHSEHDGNIADKLHKKNTDGKTEGGKTEVEKPGDGETSGGETGGGEPVGEKPGGEKTDDEKNDEKRQPVENLKPRIPETGGTGTILFLIGGLIIVGIAAVMYKRRKEA